MQEVEIYLAVVREGDEGPWRPFSNRDASCFQWWSKGGKDKIDLNPDVHPASAAFYRHRGWIRITGDFPVMRVALVPKTADFVVVR